ncbi:hypothetical protein [Nitrosomonas sp. sh817]|uniref:hypothetical protein n=1 Tax=Nitrosomonas sp. sh817 TaxID=3070658 RepID=UPI0027DE954F|nr:hypothetical protein [Nitrosomonas sp. sh817]WMJ08471.1 hypothetical protein RBH92_13765 [Nitrosomonas sp. sh817]
MQPVEVPPDLNAVIVAAAAQRRNLFIARDTHYDAFNIELRWWIGNHLHRLDFQPFPEGQVVVKKLIDIFPVAGRLLYWARNAIPMFPYLAKTESTDLGTLTPPFTKLELEEAVDGFLARAANIT